MSLKRIAKLGIETSAALIGSAFSAMLLVLTAMHAGPLWRDETNTFNLAHMPSLRDIWHNLQFDSFPLLWPLLLRGCGVLGLTDGDMGIRILGLGIGLFFLSSLWLCQRWIGGRTPILSIALLGGLPTFIFLVGANRAYGLAGCLLVLSFGNIWRLLESRTTSQILSTGFICLLFTQCLYYDVIFLGAMLVAGPIVMSVVPDDHVPVVREQPFVREHRARIRVIERGPVRAAIALSYEAPRSSPKFSSARARSSCPAIRATP